MCGEDCKSAASFILNPETRPRKWAIKKANDSFKKKQVGKKWKVYLNGEANAPEQDGL